jgi:hypothetical protein
LPSGWTETSTASTPSSGSRSAPTSSGRSSSRAAHAWTEVDVERALGHFEAAVGWSGDNLSAAVNVANCLLRLGQFAEAEARYSALESAFEHRGDSLGAARVWAGECIAAWKDRRDPDIRHSLVGAIKFFEDNLPDTADPVTLHTLKRFNEPALTLLVAVLAASSDRSDDRLEELLSALWALQRSELRADLERETPDDGSWAALHARQSSRLEITRAMLEPFPATRVVHVCSATDELVFVAYGYDGGELRLETSVLADGNEQIVGRFLELMSEQLAADLRRDEAQLAQIDDELAACGDALCSSLAPGLVELLRSGDHVYYMPHPYGALDLFPLGGLRFDGEWLAASTTITRTPTPNHLRENLTPTRPVPAANAIARVVTGDPEAGPAALRLLRAEADRAVHILGVLGFEPAAVEDATAQDLVGLLDGGAGALHYLGHGVASDVYEGLPLHSGDVLRPVHLDALPGFTTGFVFICACEAGGVRHGAGGYQTGVASRIVERGAPGVLAFTHPIVEERASRVVREFYPRALELPFGQAVRETQRRLAPAVPAYAWLSLAAFGDPDLTLPGLAGRGRSAPARAGRTHGTRRCARSRRSAPTLRGRPQSRPPRTRPIRWRRPRGSCSRRRSASRRPRSPSGSTRSTLRRSPRRRRQAPEPCRCTRPWCSNARTRPAWTSLRSASRRTRRT